MFVPGLWERWTAFDREVAAIELDPCSHMGQTAAAGPVVPLDSPFLLALAVDNDRRAKEVDAPNNGVHSDGLRL